MKNDFSLTFGPVPSRRLGRSLGINNIPPKICSYSCVYCQVGNTLNMQKARQKFYNTGNIVREVKRKINLASQKGEKIDYLAFVPDGEPTLDINIGKTIKALDFTGIKIAVITNSSNLGSPALRKELCGADWVSVKVDAVSDNIWKKVNRPHKELKLENILGGIIEFASLFKGCLNTETMLIRDLNDSREEIKKTASFISKLGKVKSYISIPTRPPAEKRVKPATASRINFAYQEFKEKDIKTEYLIGYEGNTFAFTGNIEEDILSITAVHPMREDAVEKLLKKAGADVKVVDRLVREKRLVKTEHNGKNFYLRKI